MQHIYCFWKESGMKNRLAIPVETLFPLLVACLICLTPVHSSAFVPEDLERLTKLKNCPGCDLRGADLRGVDLSEAKLEGINLMGANLEGVNLEDATLEDAGLEKANLRNANLHGASLDHASVEDADMVGADLQDATWIDGKVCKKGSIGSCK